MTDDLSYEVPIYQRVDPADQSQTLHIGAKGTLDVSGGTLTLSAAQKSALQVRYSLADYCDATGVADSAAVLQPLITAAHAAGGALFTASAGTYRLAAGLTFYPDTPFEGAGSANVIFKPDAGVTIPITMAAARTQSFSQGYYYRASGFTVDCSNGGVTTGVWLATNAIKGHLRDVIVHHADGDGFANEDINQSWKLEKCDAYRNGGIGFHFQKRCQDTVLEECAGYYNLTANCQLGEATMGIGHFKLRGCDFETGVTAATGQAAQNIVVEWIDLLVIEGVYAESHDAASRVLQIVGTSPTTVVLSGLYSNGATGAASAALYPIEVPNSNAAEINLLVLEYYLGAYDAAGAGTPATNDIICDAAGQSVQSGTGLHTNTRITIVGNGAVAAVAAFRQYGGELRLRSNAVYVGDGTATSHIYGQTGQDLQIVAQGTGKYLVFVAGGAARWEIGDNGMFYPAQHNALDLGGASLAPRDLYLGRNARISGNLGIGNSATASGPVGTVVKKIQVFDASGVSLGYLPVYDAIT